MGISSDGIIAFGYAVGEDFEFPWEDGDIDEWWKKVNGFKDLYEPYSIDGYAEGWSSDDSRFSEYFAHRHKWEDAYPMPFELVNYCSCDYPIYALIVNGSKIRCNRGYPVKFDPNTLGASLKEYNKFLKFLRDFNIEVMGEPEWMLMSYMD